MKRVWFSVLICILCLYCGSASAGEKGSAERAFSLVIREGFGSISVGDLNTTLYSLNHNPRYEYLRENFPEQCVGEIREVPNGYKDWEAELQWAAWWGFSVGLAVSGPTRFYDKSFLTYSIAEGLRQTDDDTYESEIRVSAPVKLNLYRSFPIISRVNVAINAGIGYYRARMTQTHISYEHNPSDGEWLSSFYWDVSGRRVGFHCGFALEYKFNDRFSMTAESQWRFAKINSLEGTIHITTQVFDEYGNLGLTFAGSDEGPLYHFYGQDLLLGVEIEKLHVTSLEVPFSGIDFPRDIRKAFLDLSGLTFKIGLRIRLF